MNTAKKMERRLRRRCSSPRSSPVAPDNPEKLVASAKESLAKNDRSAAVIQLKNALQKNPDLGEARLLLGKALLEQGDLAAAEKELRRARELGCRTTRSLRRSRAR